MAIGRVGGVTGMNAWIADVIMPSDMPLIAVMFFINICVMIPWFMIIGV